MKRNVSFRLTSKQAQMLKELADINEVNLSEYVRYMVTHYYNTKPESVAHHQVTDQFQVQMDERTVAMLAELARKSSTSKVMRHLVETYYARTTQENV